MNPKLSLEKVVFIFRVNLSLKEALEYLNITEKEFNDLMVYLISDPDEASVSWSVANGYYNKDLSILTHIHHEVTSHIGSLMSSNYSTKSNINGQYTIESIGYIDTYSIAATLVRSP